MSDQLPEDLLKMLMPDGASSAEGASPLLEEGLKLAAGQAGGPLMGAVDEMLSGQGDLFGVATGALSGNSSTAVTVIANFIVKQFKVPEAMAMMIAGLVVQVVGNMLSNAATKKGGVVGSLGAQPTPTVPKRTPSKTPTRKPGAVKKSRGKSLKSS